MKTIPVVFVLLWAGLAQAAGYAVDVHSARAIGMAQTMKAHVDDASAVFYNPAGLIMGRQLDVQVGDTLIIPTFRFEDKATGKTYPTEGQVVPPPHVYAAYGINDDVSVGIGMFSLFGPVSNHPLRAENLLLQSRGGGSPWRPGPRRGRGADYPRDGPAHPSARL